MTQKILAGVALAIALFAAGLLLGLGGKRALSLLGGRTTLNTATALTKVQTLSELVTVKYVLDKVVVTEDVKWYGESRVILIAHGVAKAGIDLSQIKDGDMRVTGKKVTLLMPRPRVMDVYLDDNHTEVLDRTTGVLRVFDKDLEQNARRDAIDELRHAAIQDGILKDAEERAKAQLSNLFFQMGYTEVEIKPR